MNELSMLMWLAVGLVLLAFVNVWLGAIVLIIGLFKLTSGPKKGRKDKKQNKENS